MWLDDVRPAPIGWTHVKTVQEAQAYLQRADVVVEAASLDHDLGACDDCMKRFNADPQGWGGLMPNCEHFGTGYTLVCWMEETGNWPKTPPVVHSMNPVGSRRMRSVIYLKYPRHADA
jgi:hypothetical protein